jgi:hypothetical protein
VTPGSSTCAPAPSSRTTSSPPGTRSSTTSPSPRTPPGSPTPAAPSSTASRCGRLPDPADVINLPLSGDFVLADGFNTNGITRTPDGRALLIVQSNKATIFRVNPRTGVATTVDLGGEPATNGDGILIDGRTFYVVQNQLNRIAVFHLNSSGTSGRLVERLTDPRLDVPTTVAKFGNRLYLPNARFSTPPTPTTTYSAIAVHT